MQYRENASSASFLTVPQRWVSQGWGHDVTTDVSETVLREVATMQVRRNSLQLWFKSGRIVGMEASLAQPFPPSFLIAGRHGQGLWVPSRRESWSVLQSVLCVFWKPQPTTSGWHARQNWDAILASRQLSINTLPLCLRCAGLVTRR